MKIAIVTAAYPPYLSGTSHVAQQHARSLAQQGHKVEIFTPQSGPQSGPQREPAPEREAPSLHPVKVHRLRSLLTVGNAFMLPQLVWRLRGFDVIHWHYPFFGGEWAALAAALTRTPLVVTYHQDVILTGWRGATARLLEGTFGRWALRSAEKVLFTSDDYAKASKFRPKLRPAQIATVSNGVDTHRFTPNETPHTRPFTALLVAGLGQAHYFKGVHIFLNALQQYATAHATIVGDGNLRTTYEAQASALGITERVTFTGRVSTAQLVEHYQQADVTVLPSTTMGEAFGLVLIESMACATPVIASNLPGVRSVVHDQRDGLLIQPNSCADLVAKLRQMQAYGNTKRTAMGRAGRQKVEQRYTWAAIGEELNTIYHGVAEDDPFCIAAKTEAV